MDSKDEDNVTVSVTIEVGGGGGGGETGGAPTQVGEGVIVESPGRKAPENKQEPVEEPKEEQEEVEGEEKLKESQDEEIIDKNGLEKKVEELNNGKVQGEVQLVEEVPANTDKKSKKKEKRKLTPIWKLFRFASCLDVLMILLGLFMAMASGLALPGHIILFGRIINSFSYYTRVTSTEDTGMSISEAVNGVAMRDNVSCSISVLEQIFMNRSSSGNVMLLCMDEADQVFDDVAQFACDPDSELESTVQLFSIYYVAIGVSVIIAVFLANTMLNGSAYRQTRRIRLAFYHSILHQEIGWFDVNEVNELSTRLADDVEKIQAGIGDKLVLFLNSFTTFIAGFVIAFTFNWKMALVMCTMLPIIVVISSIIAKITATFTVREQNAYAAAGGVAEEVLSSIKTVAAFGGEDHEAQRYNVQLNKAKVEGYKKGFFSSLAIGSLQLFIFCTFALGYWYGSTLIISCELGPGDVVTVFIAILLGSFSLGTALPELETFGSAMGAATTVFQIIDRKSLIDSSSDTGHVPEGLIGNIKFRDVKFRYPARPDVEVLKGLNLEVRPGQTVALVGPSGCGKSTVIQLLQRFYEPDGGQVTIDDQDVSSLNLKWWRAHVGVVSQEPVLFDTTIAENIRFGKEDATMEDIRAAAVKANAHDFITKLPHGYDTDVGESGTQMSGGQKQRIAIARALVRDPKILFLDEATSALDTESEKVVQEALDKAREGRTTIVIAHRLSTIQTADVIISIKDGVVVEQGTHLELMDNEGLYFELVTAQTISEQEDAEEAGRGELAEFRAAVKRSVSTPKTSKRLSYNKQASVMSQDSIHFEATQFSHISMEDVPVIAAPSPYPGRAAFAGDDTISITSSHKGEVDKRRPSVLANLVRRRNKITEADQEQRKVTFKELLSLNKPDWPLVVIGVIASAFIGTLFPVMAPLFSELLRIFTLNDPDEIARLTSYICAGFVGLAVLAGVFYFVGFISLAAAGERLTKRLRYNSFKAMLRQDIGWFDQKTNSTGVLTTRLASDAADVKGATGIRLGTVLQTLFGFVAALAIAFSACWEITLVFVVGFPMIGLFSFFQIRLLAGRAQKNKAKLEASGSTVVESIASIRTVVGLGVEDKFYSRYTGLLVGPFRDNIKNVLLQSLVLGVAQSVIFFIYSAGYSFGGFLVIEGRCNFDQVFRVFAAVIFTAFNLGRATSFASDAGKSNVAASRILSLLDRIPQIDVSNTDGTKLEKTRGQVAVETVHFNYPTRPEIQVLQGLSVKVEPGQTLALVGPSGCGKSTTVALIERFYDPALGSLTLEGTDLRDLNLKWLRTQIGIVSQEPILFDASIADNIRYGALFREVSDTEVIDAAKAANIHSFIESLPEGYNTNVGAKGTQLSGGQKQRIAIARALVRDPKILLLDEATSALDTESEKVVQEALDKAREGRTTIVIAHRLSTIYNSDVIAVIHNGQVIESGTHSELMANHGAYYLLNTVQLEDIDDD